MAAASLVRTRAAMSSVRVGGISTRKVKMTRRRIINWAIRGEPLVRPRTAAVRRAENQRSA